MSGSTSLDCGTTYARSHGVRAGAPDVLDSIARISIDRERDCRKLAIASLGAGPTDSPYRKTPLVGATITV